MDGLYDEEIIIPDKVYVSSTTFSYIKSSEGYYGGAHGGHNMHGKSFDLTTGKELALSDILKSGYESIVVKQIQAEISKTIKDETNPNCLGCERLGNYKGTPSDGIGWWDDTIKLEQFSLTTNGILFLFSDYELGPYTDSAGGQAILVSKTALKASIKQDW